VKRVSGFSWLAACALAIAAPVAADQAFRLFSESEEASSVSGGADERFELGLSFPALAGSALPIVTPPPPLPPKKQKTRMILVSAGVLAGSAVSTLTGGWEHGFQRLHFTQEHWFGRTTYAGGADKVSHLVFYDGLSRELAVAYRRMGYSENESYALAFGVSVAGGLIVEIGDGLTVFGFSYEDFLTDIVGAGAAVLISKNGLDDLIGFRFGPITSPVPRVHAVDNVGKDYSKEIYTADLKLAGAAQRLHWRIGPARFLYLSATYGSKGYKFSAPEFRQRDIGVEIGLNVAEVLTAVGVRDTTWWGRPLMILANFIRLPYTSIGYRYDLNHSRWHGPDNGEKYVTGP